MRYNYSMRSENSWNFYRDKLDDISYNILEGKSFKYKAEIMWKTPTQPCADDDGDRENVPSINLEVTVTLKYLSNFWRYLD